MTLKEFIEKHKCINASGLASDMWPALKTPGVNMSQKLKELKGGTGKKRITEQDTADAIKVLKAMAKDIDKIR